MLWLELMTSGPETIVLGPERVAVRQLALMLSSATGQETSEELREYGVVRSSSPVDESPAESEASESSTDRDGGVVSRALNDTFCFGAGISGRFRRAFARSPEGPDAGRDDTLDHNDEVEKDDWPPWRTARAPLAERTGTHIKDSFASDSKRPLDDGSGAFAALSLPVVADAVITASVAGLPDEPTASPPTAGHATAIFSLPFGAYRAIAIGIASVALAFVAGNSGMDFPGAALERAMLSHAPAAAADPPEWMYIDPSLPEHVLAAHMAEEPTSDPALPTGSKRPDGAVTTTELADDAAAPSPKPSREPPSTAAFRPVVPQPAARPGNSGHAGNAGESADAARDQSNASEDAAANRRALLAALPPPPPVARVGERASLEPQHRGSAAAKAGSAPTVLDKSALAAGAEVAKLATGGFEVQLIAVSRRDQAVSAWTNLVRENTDLLGALEPAIVGGEGRGSLFRLRTGLFASNEQAQSLCASLKRRNVECVVVRRGS